MTTMDTVKRKCAICGNKMDVAVLMSSSSFGPCDLDTRPAPLMRYTLGASINYCPKCGYGARNIEKAKEGVKEIVASQEYQYFIHSFGESETLFGYLGDYYINKELNNKRAAFFSILDACWVLDDMHSPKAIDARILAYNLLEENESNFVIDTKIVGVDLLRRSRQFDKAIEKAETLLKDNLKDILTNILKYQIELCKKSDDKCHNLGEMKNG